MARDIYAICVGSAGVRPCDLLHSMKWWQIQATIEGHNRIMRPSWEQTRWQTYCILSALGCKLHSPSDLIQFPWEVEQSGEQPTAEEIEELRRVIGHENANTE